jgi:Fur family ferric uptake transcriptional regulator
VTRAQRAVLTALAGRQGFASAQEIHASLRDSGQGVGLTSVYRALQSLTEQGVVDGVRDSSGETVYRQCESGGHHHHLRCVACGSTVELEAPTLERWLADVARTHGYDVTGHTIDVTGTCPRCTAS